jgi:hypothetical protein
MPLYNYICVAYQFALSIDTAEQPVQLVVAAWRLLNQNTCLSARWAVSNTDMLRKARFTVAFTGSRYSRTLRIARALYLFVYDQVPQAVLLFAFSHKTAQIRFPVAANALQVRLLASRGRGLQMASL